MVFTLGAECSCTEEETKEEEEDQQVDRPEQTVRRRCSRADFSRFVFQTLSPEPKLIRSTEGGVCGGPVFVQRDRGMSLSDIGTN